MKHQFSKFLTIATVAAASFALTGCYETGSAEKIGTVVKVGNGQGLVIKTIEAELIRGGFNGGNGATGESFHFTIPNKEMAEELKKAMENNEEVKIKYHTELFSRFSSESNGVFLDSFEVVKKKNEHTQEQAECAPAIQTNSALDNTKSGVINDKVIQLLRVQAQLIEELSQAQKKENNTSSTPKF